jgi:hypothetical protein
MKGLPASVVTAANRHWEIVVRRTMTARLTRTHDWWKSKLQPGRTPMSILSNLHENAAKHHEHAARHHREAARLHDVKDIVAAVDQAHLATDHQAHAIQYATQAAKEYMAARRDS